VAAYLYIEKIDNEIFRQYKAVSTRKLRHRGTLPTPTVEKRRKPVNTTLQLLLEEREVDEDLRLIRAKSAHVAVPQPTKHKSE
jgi:hypothetical protein